MFSVSGEFGEVRHWRVLMTAQQEEPLLIAPYRLRYAGWHRCNDLYGISRENGKYGDMLLFSMTDGGILRLGSEKWISLPAFSAAWIPSGMPHEYRTAPGCIWEFYWLDMESSLPLSQIFGQAPFISVQGMELLRREMECLLRGVRGGAAEAHIDASRAIAAVYHLLLAEQAAVWSQPKEDTVIQAILREFETDCGRKWSLQELSEKYYLSVAQLLRRFRAVTGMTPYAYLTAIRIHAAELYLQYTDLTVGEIGRRTGFSGESNFIAHFRRANGVTPRQFREG